MFNSKILIEKINIVFTLAKSVSKEYEYWQRM